VRIRIRNPQDLGAGLLFLAIALLALWVSRDYPVGTSVRMSSGYFPRLLCLLLILLGAYVTLRALVIEGAPVTRVRLRPVLLITAAVVVFAYSIQTLGLVLATVLLIMIGGYASPRVRLLEMVAASAVLAALAIAIFVKGIGLPIPIWPDF